MEIVLARLRIGHVGVRQYLHRFRTLDNPMCSNCNVKETIKYMIMEYTLYNIQRNNMRMQLAKILE